MVIEVSKIAAVSALLALCVVVPAQAKHQLTDHAHSQAHHSAHQPAQMFAQQPDQQPDQGHAQEASLKATRSREKRSSVTRANLHGDEIYHSLDLSVEYGAMRGDRVKAWDVEGWVGTDESKLVVISDGEIEDQNVKMAELWVLYSQNISTFWDVQAGIRHDRQPDTENYVVFGVSGLAPYFIDTQAHIFISENQVMSARLHVENDLLFTQRLILSPYFETEFSTRDAKGQEIGAGMATAEFGLQLRYEVTRKFAPYIDVRYERRFGRTAAMVARHGEGREAVTSSIGLQFMF